VVTATVRPARPALAARVARAALSLDPLSGVLRAFSSLFESSRADDGVATLQRVLLVAIVAAGAGVRFWGLGDVGLHGDEDTMAMATMHLVEHGKPLLPSGMYYPRGVAQLYMMAASVAAFGQSEWALRLPSALCGVLLIPLAWLAGRRFLTPAWNLAFAAAVAFLPDFIEDAQTARMYGFLVASVAASLPLIFAWERTGRSAFLAGAVLVLLLGIQFHELVVFAAFLLLFPGLLQGDRRKLWLGALGFALVVVGFVLTDVWIASQYPQVAADPDTLLANGPRAGAAIPHLGRLQLVAGGLIAIVASALAIGLRPRTWTTALSILLLAAVLAAQLALSYHVAALCAIAGWVVARRAGLIRVRRIGLYFALTLAVAAIQFAYLREHAAVPVRQILGAMLGWPSVWPLVGIADYSHVAALSVLLGIALGLWRLAHRRTVPDHLLLTVLGVWIPLLMIGFMRWNIPPRYAEAQLLPLLLCAFASARWICGEFALLPAREGTRRAVMAVAATTVCVLVVNPLRLFGSVDSGYATHPDHKGAAEFIRSLHPGPRDVLVAEDVLQQTYYLGRVDYWLVNKQVAASYLHVVNGQQRDFYTDTPLIGTGQDLQRLLDTPGRGAVYVIGSGEDQEDGRALMRGSGIAEVLGSQRLQIVYHGRDGLTEIWKAPAPVRAANAASE
jgi:hypothetical protein